MRLMAENKGTAPAPMADSDYAPATAGPQPPAPQVNVEDGPPYVVIPYVQHKLRAETQAVGASFNAAFADLTGDDQGYFKLLALLWLEGHGFILCEEDVVPTPALIQELWDCEAEWCSAWFRLYEGELKDGESRPRHPRRFKVADTLALNKFGTTLLRRAPRAMQFAAARTMGRRHFNQLDLVLVHQGAVLQGPPYFATPHLHGPVEHRTPPPWVSLIADDEWVDG